MERKTEYKKTESGIEFKEETIKTTPEDGFVHEQNIRPAALPTETRGKYHKGYSTTKSFSTNDPRITRPFAYGVCGLFFVIGLVMLLTGHWLFALWIFPFTIFGFVKSKKDIDAVAEKLKKEGKDVTIDSKEEREEIQAEVMDTFKTGFKESAKETFTQSHIEWFVKATLPIFCIIGAIAVIMCSVLVSVFLGIVVLLILGVGGFLYYGVLLKILVKISQK